MQTVQVTREVPKESKEVVDCLTVIIGDVKAKKSIAEIAGDTLPKLVVAIDGFDQVDDEFKSDKKAELAGYLTEQIMKALGV